MPPQSTSVSLPLRTPSVHVDAKATEIVVIVPALASTVEALTGAVDDRRADAEQTAAALARQLSREGVPVLGRQGGILFATFHPERVKKMVLIDAAGLRIPEVPMPDVFRIPPQNILPLVFHDLSKAMAVMPKDFGVDTMVQMFHDRSAFARLSWNPYLHDPKLRRRLAHAASVPTLIVWGKQDQLIPPVYAEEYKKLLPASRVVYIDQCGHDPTIEQPDEFAQAVIEFLR